MLQIYPKSKKLGELFSGFWVFDLPVVWANCEMFHAARAFSSPIFSRRKAHRELYLPVLYTFDAVA